MTWQDDPQQWGPYKEIHLNAWPELIEAMQAAGIHIYNIFAIGIRVFAYLEVGDDNSLANALKSAVLDKWNEKVLPWVLPEAKEGSSIQFKELERTFFCP